MPVYGRECLMAKFEAEDIGILSKSIGYKVIDKRIAIRSCFGLTRNRFFVQFFRISFKKDKIIEKE
jgi:hypothetical protein